MPKEKKESKLKKAWTSYKKRLKRWYGGWGEHDVPQGAERKHVYKNGGRVMGEFCFKNQKD